MTKALDTLDVFGAKANQFSFRRRDVLHTCMGSTAAILQIIALLAFAVIRLYLVFWKPNPDISVFEEVDKHQEDADAIDLNEINF